jgi:hypothetical protein
MLTQRDLMIGLRRTSIAGRSRCAASWEVGLLRQVVGRLIAITLIAGAAAACSPSAVVRNSTAAPTSAKPSPSPTAAMASPIGSPSLIHVHLTGLGRTKTDGIAFDYPADWHVVAPFFSLAGYTNGDANALVPTCCHLAPNQLAVSISTSAAVPFDMGALSSPGFDIRSVGDWLVAKQTIPVQPSDFVDVHTYWSIGRPGPDETVYSISAIFRGPDLAPMQAQVDAFVGSIKLDPEATPRPS